MKIMMGGRRREGRGPERQICYPHFIIVGASAVCTRCFSGELPEFDSRVPLQTRVSRTRRGPGLTRPLAGKSMARETIQQVLIVVGDATETVDTLYPYYRLQEAGFEPVVIAPERRPLSALDTVGWGGNRAALTLL
jgi:hypothetical protein